MKKLFSLSLSAIFLLATAVIVCPKPGPQGNASAAGSWDITVESPQGPRKSVLIIKQEGDKLTGLMKSERGERPLKSVAVQGSEITMVLVIPFQGDEMTITYKGKVEKDSMKGEADFGGLATGTWSAVPHKAEPSAPSASAPAASGGASTNISGVWDFKVETQAGSGTPIFTFKQEGESLSGTYKGQFGEAPVSGTVKGNDVKFTIKVNAQGQDLTVTYAGKIEAANSMSGKVTLGDFGEATWTAKKKQ